MRAYSNKNVRKIAKTGGSSYAVVIPKGMLEALGWKEKQKVVFKRLGRGLLIKDWKK